LNCLDFHLYLCQWRTEITRLIVTSYQFRLIFGVQTSSVFRLIIINLLVVCALIITP